MAALGQCRCDESRPCYVIAPPTGCDLYFLCDCCDAFRPGPVMPGRNIEPIGVCRLRSTAEPVAGEGNAFVKKISYE
jgi:hypothetical protein